MHHNRVVFNQRKQLGSGKFYRYTAGKDTSTVHKINQIESFAGVVALYPGLRFFDERNTTIVDDMMQPNCTCAT